MTTLPDIVDIKDAGSRIAGEAIRTPLLESMELNERAGGRVLIKPECLQRTGSFKFRGAYNRLSRIPDEARGKGVVAFSSGNHAQGVACAAQLLDMPAIIVMPEDAPEIKKAGVRSYGGEIIEYDRGHGDREAIARELCEQNGAVLVPSYDDFFVMAGQGTVGLEIAADCTDMGIRPDQLVCNAGGGGLIAGSGLAVKENFPDCAIWAAEPVGFDDHKRSLEAGTRVANARSGGSLQDAIVTPTPGKLTWALNSTQLSGGVTASDEDTLRAMAFAWQYLKLISEPGGSTALASILNGELDCRNKTTVVVITGGNVDPGVYARALDML